MRAWFRRHLTYANVASTLALILALGGVSYAAAVLPAKSVGAAQLKAGAVTTPKLRKQAVTTRKVKDGSLLSKDFKAGQLPAGPVGPTGPAGAVGPAGPAGAPGAPGVSGYVRVQATANVAPGDAFVSVSASCPAGKKLLGGGGMVQDSQNLRLSTSLAQANDVYRIQAELLPGRTITSNSQAFAVAICGFVQ